MTHNSLKSCLQILALAGITLSCSTTDSVTPVSYPGKATAASPKILFTTSAGVKIMNGGYGSALVPDPKQEGVFYLLTDRGPNTDGPLTNSKVFPLAGFTPQIGKFKLEGDSLKLIQTIELKDASGNKMTGLPNPAGSGGTGEIALDLNNVTLNSDPNGIDSEGLVVMKDGSFWVSDEYGPHIVHLDATGKMIEKINPFSGARALPKVLAKRKVNRGMEGLAITPDEKTLVGIMQSPLINPSAAAVKDSRVIRVVTLDIASGTTKQYAYLMDNTSMTGASEIVAITNTTFLVIERDGNYLETGKTAPAKLIYKIDLSNATDISDAENKDSGKLINGKTIDQLSETELQTAGIKPVTKSLVADVVKVIPTYPHDKVEGIAIISPTLIAISNDDDFGVTDVNKAFAQKILPSTNTVDRNTIYFIKLSTPLK